MTIASPPSLTNSCGGSVTGANSGSSAFSLSGGALAAGTNGTSAGTTCIVSVRVIGITAGVWNNSTNAVTSNEGGSGNTASATLTILVPPSITKSFSTPSIPLGTNALLSFTIQNTNSVALTGVGFTDTLPAGLVVFSGAGASCNGTSISATGGSGSISLSGATLPGNAQCNFSVTITGTSAGVKNNLTGAVFAAVAGSGNQASASILVVAPPVITKFFSPNKFIPGGTSTLIVDISNPNSVGLTGVGFTDTLPGGMLVAVPNNLSSSCGGVATATPGSGLITLTNGILGPSDACGVSVTITAANEGTYHNTTSVATSHQGGSSATGGSATAGVAHPPALTKTFSALAIPQGASAKLTFTLKNPNQTTALTGIAFTDALPSELEISTPNGLIPPAAAP
jgi:uncharacterized repeat protein (TIGR01451 family)